MDPDYRCPVDELPEVLRRIQCDVSKRVAVFSARASRKGTAGDRPADRLDGFVWTQKCVTARFCLTKGDIFVTVKT